MSRKKFCCRYSLLALAILFFTLAQAHAQCDPHSPNPPSPAAQTDVTLAGQTVTIYYCAPSLKGRTIGKDIVPYDKVWRTGANTSTTLVTPVNLKIRDLDIPAGKYTLYTLPEAKGWKLIVNKQVGQWGTVYNEGQDLGRVDMLEGVLPSAPVEVFKMNFEHTKGNKTELHLHWGTTNVMVPVEATR